jgi:hypothetical protein
MSGKSWVLRKVVLEFGIGTGVELDGLKHSLYPDYHLDKLWESNPKVWQEILEGAYVQALDYRVVSGWWPGERDIPGDATGLLIWNSRLEGKDFETRRQYIKTWERQASTWLERRDPSGSKGAMYYYVFEDSEQCWYFLRKILS